ncbi:diacylglycerol/lipid kinase family protein [Georgenia sp. Z1344]|uniref:diacylglycerol/lipid kinase family protein n=1 Tax=Georgenia sp. Z1344 TaxID=3416706 RepID=UPI003CEA26A1
MTVRVGLVINPSAGAGNGARVAAEVRAVLSDVAETEDLTSHDALHALARAHAAARDGSIDTLVVVGGDGMAHLGLNAVAGTDVPLGLVSVGSGNDVARALGLPVGKHVDSLRIIHAALDPREPSAEPRALDAIRVSRPGPPRGRHSAVADLGLVPGGEDVRWCASSLVVGFAAQINLTANRYRWPRGGAKYVRATAAETVRFSPYGVRVDVDGETREGPATLVSVSGTPLIGGGLAVAPDADPTDGLLDVVHIDTVSRPTIATLFPRFANGSHVDLRQVHVTRARRVEIHDAPEHGRPLPVAMADGEVVGRVPLVAEVVPGAWRVCAPVTPAT